LGRKEEIMTSYGFEVTCKKNLIEIIASKYGETYAIGDLHVVWFSKTLQNTKAVIVDNGKNDRYYECTLNGEKGEIYYDLYEKKHHVVMKDDVRHVND